MAKVSSDACDWMPPTCCVCGGKVRRSKDQFMANYDHTTGTAWVKCAECLKRGTVTCHSPNSL